MDGYNEGNYIKINRSILEWEWYRNINTKVLFLHMLLKANWKDGRFEGIVIPRGSFSSSYPRLAEECSLTINEFRTALKHLIDTDEITVFSHAKFSVFTVNNYCLYQGINSQCTDNQHADNSQGTGEQHSINTLLTTIEEGKKERKEEGKKEIITPPISPDDKPDITSAVYQYQQVIDYLNQKAGTNYRGTSKDTLKHIKARFDDGFSLDDFMSVIDKKVAEWGDEPQDGDKDMRQYLRPSTLFGNKFEGYLNQQIVKKTKSKGNDFNKFDQNNYDFDKLEQQLISN